MKIDEFLALVETPRPIGPGKFQGPCPSHHDKHPSFNITEGGQGILVKCWAGCSVEDICQALGIQVRDLFYDSDSAPSPRQTILPRPKRLDWRKMSHDLEFASESHWLRAESIFKAARQINLDTLNDQELDEAWQCLGMEFHSLRVSDNLANTAFQIRCNGLDGERRVEA